MTLVNVGIRDDILLKPGPLSSEEFEIMTASGYVITKRERMR